MKLTIISAILASAAGFGLAWQLQNGNIAKIQLEQKDERISQQRAARVAIERTTTAVITAQNASLSRSAVLRADAGVSRADLDRLRSTSEAAVRSAASSLDACNAVAAAQGVILAASTIFIQELAGNADQCLSDLTTMKDAWPK